jgi:O-antigen ligase
VVQTQAELDGLVMWFIVGGAGAALLGVALWALPAPLSEGALLLLTPLGYPDAEVVRMVYGTGLERATGTSVDANLFGGLMMLTACLIAGQLFAGQRVLPRSVLAAVGILVLAALVLSFSRSAWVGMGFALLYLGVSFERRALALMASCVLLVVAVPPLRERIAGAITVQDAASILRVEEYRASRDLIAAHPLLGVGFGPVEEINLVRRVSNMYLLTAEQMGLPGLLGLLMLLGAIGRRSLRWAKRSDDGAGSYAGLQAALMGMLTVGLFDHYFMNGLFPHTTGLFWLLTGLLLVAARLYSTESQPMRVPNSLPIQPDPLDAAQSRGADRTTAAVSHPSVRR